MRPSLRIFFLDPSLSKPSIKLQGVPVPGKNIAIECQGPEDGLVFSLHKFRRLTAKQVEQPAGDRTYFHFHMLRLEDVGSYTCQYHHRRKPFVWSGPSNFVELVLTDSSLPKPSIKARPQDQYDSAVTFAIECQGPEKGLKFSLYKSGDWTASLMTEPDKTTAVFYFPRLRMEQAGNYTCQYHHRAYFFLLSKPSDPLMITVRGDTSEEASFCLGAAVLVLLVLVLIVAEATYHWKKGQL
ncbi:osteoclast-associated immunoglobulin-like receptor [Tiliqua scincoides]|uniref:osteoclast-associated immunoglobulin-like receptor n=1 Tax=Tiliqua scincoides TaxID=71010 RepID=UPI0034624241